MYFTREPIIETIISPREGYKLVLRSSKHERLEEFCVDSVEVVNFGSHCFYRSLDRNVTFLLPVFDYEIIEARSSRLMVKAAILPEKEVRIGGGKPKESTDGHSSDEKKKDKKSRKRKDKGGSMREEVAAEELAPQAAQEESVKVVPPKPPVKFEAVSRGLIPPPTTLISDSISRYYPAPAKVEDVMESELSESEGEESLT